MSLFNIPKPEVIENLDFETLFSERKSRLLSLAQSYYQAAGELSKYNELEQALQLESEPMVKLLQENAYRELLLRQRINDAASSVMVPLATGPNLDNLGALYGISRGQLNDGTPEGDEQFRQRLMLAPKSLSTAGSKAAYKFHALSAGNQADKIEISAASSDELHVIYRYNSEKNLVKDATILSPSPCEIQVNVLGYDDYGNLDASAIAQIDEHLSDERIRPLGDRVTVSAAELVKYHWQITLHLTEDLEGSAQIEPLLNQVRAQLLSFVQKHHYLGKAIRRSTLLGNITPLIDGWVELTLFQNGQAVADGQDILLASHQAPHLDIDATDSQLSWAARIDAAISGSLEVVFDG